VSSGERKRMRPNRARVIPVGGCAHGVVGSCFPVPTGRAGVINTTGQGNRLEGLAAEGASPVPGSPSSPVHGSQVARASWNPA
jgi:hypothetical protein